MFNALLALLTALVGALVWVVKSSSARTDRLIEQRDIQIDRTVSALRMAVSTFRRFQEEEAETHLSIVQRLDTADQIQRQMLTEIQSMHKTLKKPSPE